MTDSNKLSARQEQILNFMEINKEYSTEEVAQELGLKPPRTRQLLNELVGKKLLVTTAVTNKRRYIRNV